MYPVVECSMLLVIVGARPPVGYEQPLVIITTAVIVGIPNPSVPLTVAFVPPLFLNPNSMLS